MAAAKRSVIRLKGVSIVAKQGDLVHCRNGHELTISQLPHDMRGHVWERKVNGDEEINLSPDSCPLCQEPDKTKVITGAQPTLAATD